MILDLGCGPKKLEGSVGIDVWPFDGVDIVRDLRRGLPFSDSTVDAIRAQQVMEHFDGEDLIFIVEEMWRVLKPASVAYIEVPDAHSPNRYRDPTHKTRDWNKDSFRLWEVDEKDEWLIYVGPMYRRQAKFHVATQPDTGTEFNRSYQLMALKEEARTL